MKSSVLLLIAVATLTLLLSIPNMSQALESNTEYFIDSPNAYIIISVNSDVNTTLLEGSMNVNGEWQTWEDSDLIFSRVSSDGEQGRFFGKTNTGDVFYGIYSIVDEPTLFMKIWTDNNKVKIIEQAVLQSLF